MAAGVSFAEAVVTGPDGATYGTDVEGQGVQVSTRNNTLRIRTQEGGVLLELPGVTAVVRQSRKRWVVRFGPEGDNYEVLRTNCGCGS